MGRRRAAFGEGIAEEAQHFAAVVHRVDYENRENRREGMQLVLERGDDPEVAAAAAEAPEQVRVLALTRLDQPPAGRYDIRRNQVVAHEAVLSHQPADAAPQGYSADARH